MKNMMKVVGVVGMVLGLQVFDAKAATLVCKAQTVHLGDFEATLELPEMMEAGQSVFFQRRHQTGGLVYAVSLVDVGPAGVVWELTNDLVFFQADKKMQLINDAEKWGLRRTVIGNTLGGFQGSASAVHVEDIDCF